MDLDNSHAAAQLSALAETTPDVLITIDTNSRIQFVNPAIEDVLGYTPDELQGQSLMELMSETLAVQHEEAITRFLSTGTRTLDWEQLELPGKHRAGHEVPLSISFSEFSLDGERYFTGIMRDISERRALETERDLLHATRDAVVQAETFTSALASALDVIGERMDWHVAEAWVPADDTCIELEAAWTADGKQFDEFCDGSPARRFGRGEGLVGRVWASGEHELVEDIVADGASTFVRSGAAARQGLRTALAMPITTDDTVLAVLVFLTSARRGPDDWIVTTTRGVTADLGLVIGRREAEDALRQERNLVSNVLETTPAGIVVLTADGAITYANERAESLLGLDAHDDGEYPDMGDIPIRFLHADDAEMVESEYPYRRVLRTGTDVATELQMEFPDGCRRWLGVRATPLRDESGAIGRVVVAFEDITEQLRWSERLERLNELGQELLDAKTFDDACSRAIDAADDILDPPIATLALYDADDGKLVTRARTPAVDELLGDDAIIPPDGDVAWQAFVEDEVYEYSDSDREGVAQWQTPLDSAIILPLTEHGVFIAGGTATGAISENDRHLAYILAGTVEAAFDRLDRERSLRRRTDELSAKNDQLRRLHRINDDIRDVTQALLDADSREEIKRVVCDQLADGDHYVFVWFGERDLRTDEIVPAAWAGAEDGYLDAVTVTADGDETGLGPAGRAIRTRSVQMQNDFQSDPPFEPWRQQALQRGYRAGLSFPVVYRDTLYGVVNLYASEADVFTEMEAAVMAELGEMIGYGLNAMERYDALVAEDSVELEFVVQDESHSLLTFLREQQGRFTLESIGEREGDAQRIFATFEGVSREAIESHIAGTQFHALTVIRDDGSEVVVEVSLPADSLTATLLERGAVPTEMRGSPDEGTLKIRISKTASVREFLELLESRFDEVELVARKKSPDPVQTTAQFERAFVDRLTDRQREVLHTAYFAGFFEQPRKNTARDIADMLGVSQPTISRHVRSGEQALFSMLFEDE